MNLLLLSLGMGAVSAFLERTTIASSRPLRLGYLADAASAYADAPFVLTERAGIDALGHDVVDLRAAGAADGAFATALDDLDALYVASGSTFALLAALRSSGADRAITARVRAGLPYIGTSAGSIVAGASIEPASLMDDPADAPDLHDYTGLGMIEGVVIPHADGQLPPYPLTLIERTLDQYGTRFDLIPLHDDQALLVDSAGSRVIDSPA